MSILIACAILLWITKEPSDSWVYDDIPTPERAS